MTAREISADAPGEEPAARRDAGVAMALWQAWMELNAIRARDGAPQHIDWYQGRPIQTHGCDPDYFGKVVDDCAVAFRAVTGEEIKPWPPKETRHV